MDQSKLSGGRPGASRCSEMANGTTQAAAVAEAGAVPASCAARPSTLKPLPDTNREGLSFVTGNWEPLVTEAVSDVDLMSVRARFLEIKVVAAGAASNLRELVGCEIDAGDMLAALGLLQRKATDALACLPQFPVGVEPDGDMVAEAAQSARAIKVVAEGAASNIREMSGCRIERADMLAVLTVIRQAAEEGAPRAGHRQQEGGAA